MGQAGLLLVEERFNMYSYARRLVDVDAEPVASPFANELWTSTR
jgi:hypothetical protein